MTQKRALLLAKMDPSTEHESEWNEWYNNRHVADRLALLGFLSGRQLSTPLQTEGTAWDAAWAAVYLASDEARWVTGVALPIDGGALLTRRVW